MRVTDPDGVDWEVSRDWLDVPHWWRRDPPGLPDTGGGWVADDTELGTAAAVILLLLLVVFVGFPALLFAAALLVALGGLVLRVVFGRPWRVEAKSDRGELAWRVRGIRGSRRALHEVAAALRRGERDVLPAGAERLLPASPFADDERSNVRVLR